MITNETKSAINNATTITPQESDDEVRSNIKVIYGPLLKYGFVAIGMVSIIVTTTVMTERQVEDYSNNTVSIENIPPTIVQASNEVNTLTTERPVTDSTVLKSDSVIAEATETNINAPVSVNTTVNSDTQKNKTIQGNIEIIVAKQAPDALAVTVNTTPRHSTAMTLPVTTPITTSAQHKPVAGHSIHTAQHSDYIQKQDQQQLVRLQQNHEHYINVLRAQGTHQNRYLEQNIQQIEANYLKQLAALKRSQRIRQSFNNAI